MVDGPVHHPRLRWPEHIRRCRSEMHGTPGAFTAVNQNGEHISEHQSTHGLGVQMNVRSHSAHAARSKHTVRPPASITSASLCRPCVQRPVTCHRRTNRPSPSCRASPRAPFVRLQGSRFPQQSTATDDERRAKQNGMCLPPMMWIVRRQRANVVAVVGSRSVAAAPSSAVSTKAVAVGAGLDQSIR